MSTNDDDVSVMMKCQPYRYPSGDTGHAPLLKPGLVELMCTDFRVPSTWPGDKVQTTFVAVPVFVYPVLQTHLHALVVASCVHREVELQPPLFTWQLSEI